MVAAGLACGGNSLEIPTPTAQATVMTQPAQVPAATPTNATGAAPTGSVGGQQQYTVQAGDTLGAIASQFGVTVDAIVQANEITDANFILPGETLIIPRAQ